MSIFRVNLARLVEKWDFLINGIRCSFQVSKCIKYEPNGLWSKPLNEWFGDICPFYVLDPLQLILDPSTFCHLPCNAVKVVVLGSWYRASIKLSKKFALLWCLMPSSSEILQGCNKNCCTRVNRSFTRKLRKIRKMARWRLQNIVSILTIFGDFLAIKCFKFRFLRENST